MSIALLIGGVILLLVAAFAFYYNYQRPNQALDNRTPVEVVTNARLDTTARTL